MNENPPVWDHWRSFLAVVNAGSLLGAAGQLGLTQPTVARHVDALEASVSARLFTRSRHGLTPTPLAMTLIPQAEAMSAAAEALRRTASGARDEVHGTVRVTASEAIGTFILPPILASFRERYPAIVIELALSNRNANLLRRDVDIALRMARPTQAAVVACQLDRARIGLFAHESYLARHRAPQTVEELSVHPLIGIDRDEWLIAGVAIGKRPLTRADHALRCDSDAAQVMAIAAGFGIGPCHLAIAATMPQLVQILPDTIKFGYDMWVAMHEDLRDTQRVRLLFDHIARQLRRSG